MTATRAARPVERKITADLLARYDRPGPRYTSYPTAVEFADGFTTADYETRLAAADALGDAPLSLYVHLPFCEERCLFCGCHVIVTKHREMAAPYLEMLKRETALLASRLPHRRRIAQLHLGGGTPTYYTPAQLTDLLTPLLREFRPMPGAELALEADPRVLHQGRGLFERLHAIHRALDFGGEVLDAERDAVEAEIRECIHVRGAAASAASTSTSSTGSRCRRRRASSARWMR